MRTTRSRSPSARRGIAALIGPNGAGKSTLFSLVGRLLEPEGGRVVVDGLDAAATYADRIAAMRGGTVVADAPSTDVMDPGVLEAVYDTPVDVRQIDGKPVALHYS